MKKRLPKKFYYEMFVDNNIWSGILVILELLEGDKHADLQWNSICAIPKKMLRMNGKYFVTVTCMVNKVPFKKTLYA